MALGGRGCASLTRGAATAACWPALQLARRAAMIAAALSRLRGRGRSRRPASDTAARGLLIDRHDVSRPITCGAQLFSLALFAWMPAMLVTAQARPYLLLWSIPLRRLLGGCVHGGWLVGAGTRSRSGPGNGLHQSSGDRSGHRRSLGRGGRRGADDRRRSIPAWLAAVGFPAGKRLASRRADHHRLATGMLHWQPVIPGCRGR